MAVTINEASKLFVIESGNGYSCLGFDVVFNYIKELVARLNKRGISAPDPELDQKGTLSQYAQYLDCLKQYTELNDTETWFSADVPIVIRVTLEECRKSGDNFRIFYGDSVTGRSWMEEYDTIGRIGRSMGPMRTLLLVPPRKDGGCAISGSAIVKITNVTTGREVYKHPFFHVPEIKVVPDDTKGYPFAARVYADGEWAVHARFKTEARANAWVDFIQGKRNRAY